MEKFTDSKINKLSCGEVLYNFNYLILNYYYRHTQLHCSLTEKSTGGDFHLMDNWDSVNKIKSY